MDPLLRLRCRRVGRASTNIRATRRYRLTVVSPWVAHKPGALRRRRAGYAGAVVLHGLQEAEVRGALAFVRERIAAAGATGEDAPSSR